MTDIAKTRAQLIDIVRARSFSTGGEMKLASGRTSNFYFNMKPTMLHPEGAHLITLLILDALKGASIDYIGGLEMGAVPLAACVAAQSHVAGTPISAFFVRKQAKDHGAKKLVEGLPPGVTLAGKRIVVIEDVTTTGGSAMKAIDALKAEGAIIDRVITVVDRQEGAAETFKAGGVAFQPLLTAEAFR